MTEWVHMSGAGNTFLVGTPFHASKAELNLDNSVQRVPDILATNPRGDGKSIEGLMVIDVAPSTFTCQFYNPDGTHGMLCGNGARCAVRFALDHGVTISGNRLHFTLNDSDYEAIVDTASNVESNEDANTSITIVLQPPSVEQLYAVGSLRGVECLAYYVFVPSDHVVIDIPATDMRTIVTRLRHHEVFPRGTNVNMVSVEQSGIVNIATFERGVEAVTGACGTGAIAAAVALWRQGRIPHHVQVRPPSGRMLEVTINHHNSTITSIELRGDAYYDS